jgi:TetR/AcrR family transcriptional repressor of nem operon
MERSRRPATESCVLVNSALEIAPRDPDFQRVVADVMVQVEGFFRRCVAAGQSEGTISGSQSAKDLARLLLSTLLGLRVLARTRPERQLLKGVLRPVLALLDNRPLRRSSARNDRFRLSALVFPMTSEIAGLNDERAGD